MPLIPLPDARRPGAVEAILLSGSLGAIPLLCTAMGAMHALRPGLAGLLAALTILAYLGLAWRGYRKSRDAATQGDLRSFAHHAAYPLSLIATLTGYQMLLVEPYAYGLKIAA